MPIMATTTTLDIIVFEQPLNEQMRICLRLEQLFKQLKESMSQSSISASKIALTALLKIISVVDRPDLKSKLTQTMASMPPH